MTLSMNVPFGDWIQRQRWYAGRGREQVSVEPAAVTPLPDEAGTDLQLVLLDVAYTDGSTERYQVLLRFGGAPIDEYSDVATIGTASVPGGERIAYDALYDPDAASHLLALIDSSAIVEDLRFLRGVGYPGLSV